jgi:hypothetical protein
VGRHRRRTSRRPDQLASALGPDKVSQLSSQTGIDSVRCCRARRALPAIINALTPDGKVPAGGSAAGSTCGMLEASGASAAAPVKTASSGWDVRPRQFGSILGDKQ